MHSAARLIAGSTIKTVDATFVRAGVEIRLDAGWHTYWRYPGDSGVPPTFDFTGSQNVESVKVLWPAPDRFPDGAGGYSNGYKGDIVLPLQVVRKDVTNGSAIRLKLAYAVCEKLCVPAEADLKLDLGDSAAEQAVIERAELRVPKRVLPGAGGLTIRSVHREPRSAHDRLVVEIAAPESAPVELFVEGPTPDWSLPPPELTSGNKSGKRRFTLDLDGLPPGVRPRGAALTFTIVSPDDAVEVVAPID